MKDHYDLNFYNVQEGRSRLIVTDGVFSMDGNVCPLPEIKVVTQISSITVEIPCVQSVPDWLTV